MKKLEKKWMSLMKKLNLILSSFFIILLIFSSNKTLSEEKIIFGKAKIIDGDTIKINNNKIRLYGIDAPEIKQLCKRVYLNIYFLSFKKKYLCGKISAQKLKKLLSNKIIKCHIEGIDRYKRILAICHRNKLNINSWLVRTGQAVAYKKYSKKYIIQEAEARKSKLGIWRGDFEMPWEWRKNNK